MLDLPRLQSAYRQVRDELLAQRTDDGHWVGELSSSALSTATAVSALAVVKAATSGRGPPGGVQGSGLRVQEASGGRQPPDGSVETFDSEFLDSLISRGISYLATQQNPDGGFGDTDLSHSNIATTYLVVAAMHLTGVAEQHAELLARADAYLESKGRLAGLRERYGIDKTFVVPIMTNLALAGLLDWREIDPLPFELACVPQAWYRFAQMPVVSYAIPALVAIGQARFHHAPPWNPVTRLVRWLSISRSLRVLRRMQPDSGGYLEATPLTAFVVMSLASLAKPRPVVGVTKPRPVVGVTKPRPVVGVNDQTAPNRQTDAKPSGSDQTDHDATTNSLAPRPMVGALNAPMVGGLNPIADDVIQHGVKFLAASIRPDGSWPIDTNLATWNTTLAINALAGAGEDVAELLSSKPRPSVAVAAAPECDTDSATTGRGFGVLDWLLSRQHTKRHPFTGADPGGFGWTDLSGAVPDADDTPGAVISLFHLLDREAALEPNESPHWKVCSQSHFAIAWLVRLQNSDHGWPTFCRGWGRLPFDRSGNDLTAHAVRALESFRANSADLIRWIPRTKAIWKVEHVQQPISHGLDYLRRRQRPNGSWSPLWFGNQDHPEEDNPVYGTAKVLFAYRDLGLLDSLEAQRGVAWLVANQNEDGGWGSGVWEKVRSAECGVRNGGENAASNLKSEVRNLKSSVEETALAVEALLAALPTSPQPLASSPLSAAVEKGLNWLLDRVECGEHRQPAPIGFYFAKLWYYERLYPLTFTVAALGRACRVFAPPAQLDSHAQPAPARVP